MIQTEARHQPARRARVHPGAYIGGETRGHLKMPRMGGMEQLRRLGEFSHLPVIFLTGKTDEVDELLGLKWQPTISWISDSRNAS
jgi:hypothetical protein